MKRRSSRGSASGPRVVLATADKVRVARVKAPAAEAAPKELESTAARKKRLADAAAASPAAAKKQKKTAALVEAAPVTSDGEAEDEAEELEPDSDAAPSDTDDEAALIKRLATLRAAKALAARTRSLIKQCATCMWPAPMGSSATWVCERCSLRGDLPAESATNLAMARLAAHAPSPSASPGALSVSASPGQTAALASVAAAAAALTPLEKQFNAITARGITGGFIVPSTPLTQAAIDSELRRSLHATRHPPVSAALRAMITAGRCSDVGFAIERTIESLQLESATNANTVAIVNTVLTSTTKIIAAPELSSPTDLLGALVSTIGPSLLVHNPAALLQWFVLIRTVLAINADATLGWSAARNYMRMTLAERMLDDASLSPVDASILTSVTTQALSRMHHAAPHTPHASSSSGAREAPHTPRQKRGRGSTAQTSDPPTPARSADHNATFQLCAEQKICNNFNFAQTPCPSPCIRKLLHACPYRKAHGCTNTEAGHRGAECDKHPGKAKQ